MTKKQKQSKKSSKRTKGPAWRDDETDTATTSALAEAPQATTEAPEAEVAVEPQQVVATSAPAAPATPATLHPTAAGESQQAPADAVPLSTPVIPDSKVAVESQQAEAAAAPATPVAPVILSAPNTRSEAAKSNIKEGLRLHQIAGRPTKQQLILVFGKGGYLLTWPKRIERFGITPETFQAALAMGVQATPLVPAAEKSKKS